VKLIVEGLFVPDTHKKYLEVVSRDIRWSFHAVVIDDDHLDDMLRDYMAANTEMGFEFEIDRGDWQLSAPIWFPVMLSFIAWFLTKPPPRIRVSSSDLAFVAIFATLSVGLFELLANRISI